MRQKSHFRLLSWIYFLLPLISMLGSCSNPVEINKNVKVTVPKELTIDDYSKRNIIKIRIKEFLKNDTKNLSFSENAKVAAVSLGSEKPTNYTAYLEVYNNIKSAYLELWEEASLKLFNKSFIQLNYGEERKIKSKIPLNIIEIE